MLLNRGHWLDCRLYPEWEPLLLKMAGIAPALFLYLSIIYYITPLSTYLQQCDYYFTKHDKVYSNRTEAEN